MSSGDLYLGPSVFPGRAQRATDETDSVLARILESGSFLLEKVQAVLAANGIEERLSCRKLAARVGLSHCHFCTVFRAQTGVTFTEFRMRSKVAYARKLLLERKRRVSDVAFAVGFESIPHFNRIFRRYVGCSPTDYRFRIQN